MEDEDLTQESKRVQSAIRSASDIVDGHLCPRNQMFPNSATADQKIQIERGWEKCVLRVAEMILREGNDSH